MPHLTIRKPAQERRRVQIDGEVFRIGRAPDNDLAVKDWRVADYHSELVREDGVYWLRDLGTESATLVNRERCEKQQLHAGDEIRIGAMVLEFRADEDGSSLSELRLPVDELTADRDDASSVELERERFALLYKVGKKVLSASSIDDLNDFALSLVFECVKAERGALLLEDPDSGEFRPGLLRHRDGRRLDSESMRVPSSIVREATTERVGILTEDAMVDDRFKERDSVQLEVVRSALCAPLWYEGEVLGVIYLDSQIHTYAFTREDLILLNAVANLIAIRIRQQDLNAEVAEQRVMRSNLERYHSPDVVEEILNRTRAGRGDFGLEERDVTVLFADIKGFTPLAETLSSAVVANLLNEYYAVATRAIFEHGGTVNEFIGDSVMAIFGAPVAHEDQADRAVRAGLALLDAIEGRAELVVRVAINSGRVLVGSIGPPSRLKYAAVGDAVNVASRLEGHAKPGYVTIGEDTYRLLRATFPCEDLGLIELRGHEAPIHAYRIPLRE